MGLINNKDDAAITVLLNVVIESADADTLEDTNALLTKAVADLKTYMIGIRAEAIGATWHMANEVLDDHRDPRHANMERIYMTIIETLDKE